MRRFWNWRIIISGNNRMHSARKELLRSLKDKIKEAVMSIAPITIIVLVLHFTVAPMPLGMLALFVLGAVLLTVGMGVFTLGADLSMMPMGESIGSELTKSRKLLLLIIIAFLLGMFITIAEPDLKVLAGQVPAVPDAVLILTVALGVGIFLAIGIVRIIFQIRLSMLLIIFYAALFILTAFVPTGYMAVSFDSGGVTTGPMTVPFILALGIGVSAVMGGKSSRDDSFGLVALSSIGPILAVLLLGMFYNTSGNVYEEAVLPDIHNFSDLMGVFGHNFPEYFKEVAFALLPIIIFFLIFQFAYLKLPKSQMIRMGVGLGYTYIGLVLFLTAVNVAFMPVGNYMGSVLSVLDYKWILIPIGGIMGFFVVMAEPAVHVLNSQVEEITVGAISKRSMLMSLSIGVAISVALAMIRVLYSVPIIYIIGPGYALALVLTFFSPKVFTAIAFDSGGVASGPMTAAFMLPFAMGVSEGLGKDVMANAFGIVALVALTPLITIQITGIAYKLKLRKAGEDEEAYGGLAAEIRESEDEIIDL